MTDILIVDDHPLYLDGFVHLVGLQRPHWTLRTAVDGVTAMSAVEERRPDLVLLDGGLPGSDGFALMRSLAARWPALATIMVSGREDAAARLRARSLGARAYLAKSLPADAMLAAIDAVLSGRAPMIEEACEAPTLTERQSQVLDLLACGHGNKEIRHRLGIAERTVRAHLTDIFQLLGAHSRTHAVVRARELGLIP